MGILEREYGIRNDLERLNVPIYSGKLDGALFARFTADELKLEEIPEELREDEQPNEEQVGNQAKDLEFLDSVIQDQ